MDNLQAAIDQLEDNELDYVFERSRVTSDAAAYKAAGMAKATFYTLPRERRDHLNSLAQQLKRRAKMRAQFALEEAAEDAARKVIELMADDNSNVALKAAQDVLDRTAGRAIQRQQHEVSGKDGGVIRVQWSNEVDGDD